MKQQSDEETLFFTLQRQEKSQSGAELKKQQLSDSGFMSQQSIRLADDRHLLPAGVTTLSS